MRRVLGAALLLVACGGERTLDPPGVAGAGATSPRRGGTLVVALSDDIRSLDPAFAFDENSGFAAHMLHDTLLDYAAATAADPTELVPELAESWSVSPDGTVYSFTLRDAKYADGRQIVADDFVFTFDRLVSPELASPFSQFYRVIAGAGDRLDGKAPSVSGLRAVDDRHLEIRLERRDPSFALLVALPTSAPMPRAHATKVGEHVRDTPLPSGPFVLESWRESSEIVFARNPAYWNPERPYLDRVVVKLLNPHPSSTLSFLNGELDLDENPSADDYLHYAASPAWQPHILRTVRISTNDELMNVRMKPFDDRRVRQAFNYAIRKEDTVRLYNGRAVVANGFLPPGMPGHDPKRAPYPHDPAKARRLLAEAGYPEGFDVTYTTLRDDLAERVAQSMQSDLAEVGVRMKIQLLTFPAYLSAIGNHEVPFAFTGWYMDFLDPWDFLEAKFSSRMNTPGSTNETSYENPEVDRLLDAARIELDREKRLALYHQVEDIVFEDCPMIWHYFPVWIDVAHPYVKGYARHPVWGRSLRETWLDEPRRAAR